MSADIKCRLCESIVSKDDGNADKAKEVLMNHFSAEHKINTHDTNVLNNLLLIHEQSINKKGGVKRKRSLSQSFIPHGKENITPIKVRQPLRERTTNDGVETQPAKNGIKDLPSISIQKESNGIEINEDIDSSLLMKPNAWMNLEDGNSQLEVSSSPICVIASVASADQLSSSILEEIDKHTVDQNEKSMIEFVLSGVEEDSNVLTDSKEVSFNDVSCNKIDNDGEDSGSDTSWLSESNYEVINQRRLKTTAENGRYICPNHECSFKCESKVLINIHVRKRHSDMFGEPIKRQEMKIFLEPVSIHSMDQKVSNDDELSNTRENQTSKSVAYTFVDDADVPRIEHIQKSLKRSKPDDDSFLLDDKENEVRPAKRIKLDNRKHKVDILKNIKKEKDVEAPNQVKYKTNLKMIKKENEVNKTDRERTIEKMRMLQSGKSYGTYVQCCVESCEKWRFLEGCEDPSQIPDNWQCSMNTNILRLVYLKIKQSINLSFFSNSCDKGVSEEFVEDNGEFVDTQYAAGSMVWAKMKGYPWWPALVDFCPDTDEYYWLDSWSAMVIKIKVIDKIN